MLLVQRSPELEKEIAAAEGELQQERRRICTPPSASCSTTTSSPRPSASQKQREVKELKESIKSLQTQLELLNEKKDEAADSQPDRRPRRHLECAGPAARIGP